MQTKKTVLSEAVYRAIVEGSTIAKVMIDRQGMIVLINAQVEKLFGYARDELLGKPIEILVPKAARGRHPAMRDGYFKDPRPRFMGVGRDLAGTRRDGREFPVEVGLYPIKTAEGEFVVATINDITERKRAEEKFRAVVEAAPTAMIMINESGDIVLTNAETTKLFGYATAELLGRKVDLLVPDSVRPGHPKLRDGFFADPRPRQMGVGRDLNGRRKDGSLMPVEIGLNPIVTSEGKFAIAAIADISERKRVEEKMRDITAQKHVEAEVSKQRNRELERMAELERFQKLTVGRELKMIELKKEIEELTRQLDQSKRQGRETK